MSLIRKVRKVGSSLIITIPSQVANFYEIVEGTKLEVSPTGDGKLILKKVIE